MYSFEVDNIIFTCDQVPAETDFEYMVSIIYKDLSFQHHEHICFTDDDYVRLPMLFDKNRRLLFIHSSRGL